MAVVEFLTAIVGVGPDAGRRRVGALDPPVERLVGLAHADSERLVALVDDILDFEKLRARELRVTPEPVDLVADRGPGVPPAFVERLFEPFAQADDLPTRRRGGTGLGLAISRALAEQMGGAITLEPPRPGRGAVFRLALPKPPAAAP